MSVSFLNLSSKRKAADLFVAGVFEGASLKDLKALEPTFVKAASHAQAKGRFSAKNGQSFTSYSPGHHSEAPEILLLGLGSKKSYKAERLRQTIGKVVHTAKTLRAKKIRIHLDSFVGANVKVADAAGIISEMNTLAQYSFDQYKKIGKQSKKKEVQIEVLSSKKGTSNAVQKTVRDSKAVAEGALLTRTLINEPANVMNAQRLALEAKKLANAKKLSCQVLGYSEIKRLKMGGVLAVNQGATTPPAFIILEHGKKYKSKGTICLIGKGVTFDTGGISIKPAKSMEKMKYDMSGAAAVIGAMSAVADLKLPLHVVGLTPAVENNVAEDPQRPGDIIRMFNGKTVEVINTDAEGRLILADALAYSAKYKPKAIIDLATLTGMAAYTFGNQCSAVLGNDAKLISRLKQAGEVSGERCWELPMYDAYAKQIKGHHSDLLNVGGMFGGTITAAKFLQEFVPAKTAWAHLDIAGVAWCDSPRYDCPIGGTGFGVKLITQFLSSLR